MLHVPDAGQSHTYSSSKMCKTLDTGDRVPSPPVTTPPSLIFSFSSLCSFRDFLHPVMVKLGGGVRRVAVPVVVSPQPPSGISRGPAGEDAGDSGPDVLHGDRRALEVPLALVPQVG